MGIIKKSIFLNKVLFYLKKNMGKSSEVICGILCLPCIIIAFPFVCCYQMCSDDDDSSVPSPRPTTTVTTVSNRVAPSTVTVAGGTYYDADSNQIVRVVAAQNSDGTTAIQTEQVSVEDGYVRVQRKQLVYN